MPSPAGKDGSTHTYLASAIAQVLRLWLLRQLAAALLPSPRPTKTPTPRH